MKSRQRLPLVLILCMLFVLACEPKNKALEEKDDPGLSAIKLLPGFKIGFFATDVPNADSGSREEINMDY